MELTHSLSVAEPLGWVIRDTGFLSPFAKDLTRERSKEINASDFKQPHFAVGSGELFPPSSREY